MTSKFQSISNAISIFLAEKTETIENKKQVSKASKEMFKKRKMSKGRVFYQRSYVSQIKIKRKMTGVAVFCSGVVVLKFKINRKCFLATRAPLIIFSIYLDARLLTIKVLVDCLLEDQSTEMLHDVTSLLLSGNLLEAKFYWIKL